MCTQTVEPAPPASISVQFMFEKWLKTRMWTTHRTCMWWSGNSKQSTQAMHMYVTCAGCVYICVCIGVVVHVKMLRNSRNVLVNNTTHSTVAFCSIQLSFSYALSHFLEFPFSWFLALIFWRKVTKQWGPTPTSSTATHWPLPSVYCYTIDYWTPVNQGDISNFETHC